MLKKFFISFLGSLAAIWISVIIAGVLFIVGIAAIGASAIAGASSSSSAATSVERHSVLRIALDGEITDRPTPVNIMDEIYGQSSNSIALNDLITSIKHAATDKDIDGILLQCDGATAGLAQSQSIIDALNEFRDTGKWVYAYGDTYTQGNYFIASAADSIFLNPIGMVDIHGLQSTGLYFKGLLDKIGVEMQVVKVGTYKSAVEPYILTHSSEANREQTLHYISSIWSDMTATIADARGVDTTAVNRWADSYSFATAPENYITERIADRLLYGHQLDSLVCAKSGLDPEEDDPRFIGIDDYVAARKLSDLGHQSGKKRIAVLYAVGDIVEAGGSGINSSKLVPQILDLADDKDIDGLILRVNSPGGSAFASEQIWEALEQFKKRSGRPFYVSMGDVAASGGYYISCGADRIYADPLTITGSIGIFGLIPNAQKLMNDKLGITTSTVSTNSGTFPTFTEPMSEKQRAAMQGYVDRGYELFVGRVASGRDMSVDSVKAIAEGRVWDGRSALSLGLVDRMGGMMQAIADMAEEIEAGDDYCIREYPRLKFKWWEEILTKGKNIRASMVRGELGELAPLYDAAESFRDMDRLQCRMEHTLLY